MRDQHSSSSNCVWASHRKCGNPLEKLLLLRIADAVGGSCRYMFDVNDLAEFSCADSGDVYMALAELEHAGHIRVLGVDNIHRADIALPWYEGELWSDCHSRDIGDRAREHRLWKEQDGLCWYCGDPMRNPEFEHKTPKSRGGTGRKTNIVLACRPCNQEKRDRNVEEYRAFLQTTRTEAVVFHGEREQ